MWKVRFLLILAAMLQRCNFNEVQAPYVNPVKTGSFGLPLSPRYFSACEEMSRYRDMFPVGVFRCRKRIGSFDVPIVFVAFVACFSSSNKITTKL